MVIKCTCAQFLQEPLRMQRDNDLLSGFTDARRPESVQAFKISTKNPISMAKSPSSSSSSFPPVAPDTTGSAVSLPALPASYEAALQELEGLVARLDSGQLPLDQLLTGYQRGAQLLKFCRDRLEAVENQIKVLEGTELKPWSQA